MDYPDPAHVTSPKRHITSSKITVLYDTGPDGWSVAEMEWNGQPSLGIRWNGGPRTNKVGIPNAHGYPAWLVLPDELALPIHERVLELRKGRESPLAAAYREAAMEQRAEQEAHDWCEGTLGATGHEAW